MWPFKKKEEKKDQEADPNTDPNAEEGAEPEVPVAPPEQPPVSPGSMGDSVALVKLSADVEKLKAQFTTFYELQKASNERFSRIQEQIGELRSMMIERDKDSQRLEAKATQAVDLVKTVQPDKFMVDLRRMDSKIEALKANLESNETVIKNAINEIKALRDKMAVFSGMEQVIKMNDEVKGELMEIRKLQSTVERHADKVETIFTEMQKKTSDFVRFNDIVKDLDKSFKLISAEFDSIKVKMTDFSTKKELENLIAKFDDFEKYVGSLVSLLSSKFEKLEHNVVENVSKRLDEVNRLVIGFRALAEKTPDLDKYFHLLDEESKKKILEQQKQQPAVEKLRTPGADEPALRPEKKEGIVSRMTDAVSGAAATLKDKMAKK
jgi:predicted  nucleic acid-binding Zn-ribbon protein